MTAIAWLVMVFITVFVRPFVDEYSPNWIRFPVAICMLSAGGVFIYGVSIWMWENML